MGDRYQDINNTSPVVKALRDKETPPSSAFDFGNVSIGQLLGGAIIPIDLIRTIPKEKYKISYDLNILGRSPMVRKVMSSMRVYVKSFINYDRNLWQGAKNYITRGYSGNLNIDVPYIELVQDIPGNESEGTPSSYVNTSTPLSLSSFFGIGANAYDVDTDPLLQYCAITDKTKATKIHNNYVKINALPFVMYQGICRDFYYNSNLLYENKKLYPDNAYNFILPYDAAKVNVLDFNNPYNANLGQYDYSANGPVYVPENNSDTPVLLNALHFGQRKGDAFSAGVPFPDLIRGDIPFLDMQTITAISDDALVTALNGSLTHDSSEFVPSTAFKHSISKYNSHFRDEILLSCNDISISHQLSALQDLYSVKVKDIASKLKGNNITLNAIRSLEAYTRFREKNALAQGDYNSLIKAQFGSNPRAEDYKSQYIGGFYQDIVFSEVTQMSETEQTPLGTVASKAVSNSSGHVGSVYSEDYGYIMTLLFIQPDTFYAPQGIDRFWTELSQDEVYFPVLNELPPQATLNKELFITENESIDNDVFNYTERFQQYKSRRNRTFGLTACGDKFLFDRALVQQQYFDGEPLFNNSFNTLSPKNFDMTIFSASNEPPFDAYIRSRIDKVSPMPYKTIPGGL